MPELKIRRKLFRMVGLLFPCLYLAGDRVMAGAGLPAAVSVVTAFLAIMFALEWVRFRRPGVNRWLFDHFRAYTKEKERARTSSTTLFLAACLLTLLVFNKGVCLAAMLMLVFGDPVAELVGTRWGRVRLLGKSLEGTLGGFAACLLAAAPLIPCRLGLGIGVILAGAAAATVCELLPLALDDNFVIPLGAGAVMTLVQATPAGGGDGSVVLSPLLETVLSAAFR